MTSSVPQFGYTLPVFATASAIAALYWLRHSQPLPSVSVDLIEPPEIAEIPIAEVAGIREGMALAITRSNPGDNLDITRNTPIWVVVEWGHSQQTEPVKILGGEGIGRHVNQGGKAAIYHYAQQLLHANLTPLLAPHEKIQLTIILPEGRKLAQRTANPAFGIVEGLSLLGTTGISQPLSVPDQLELYRQELQEKAALLRSRFQTNGGMDLTDGWANLSVQNTTDSVMNDLLTKSFITNLSAALVFCIGENGLDLAQRLGIESERLVKTANWLGPLLVEAGLQNVPSILLLGYHGKLIKLAGGIFHTHHHLADGRLEILTAYCAQVGLPTPVLQKIFTSPTTEAALKYLRQQDASSGTDWVNQVYRLIGSRINTRCQDYIRKHADQAVRVSSVLFDGDRQIIVSPAIE